MDTDPIETFHQWYAEAGCAGIDLPEAMTLATATPDGVPSARMVLLKGADERGFTFFTNHESQKGRELAANPRAALVFHWQDIGKQVRVSGRVRRVTRAEAEEYWATRHPASRISASVSRQSRPIGSRAELEAAVAAAKERYPGQDVPLPRFWGGYRVAPDVMEFWIHREDRLHDRVRYTRRRGGRWQRELLAP